MLALREWNQVAGISRAVSALFGCARISVFADLEFNCRNSRWSPRLSGVPPGLLDPFPGMTVVEQGSFHDHSESWLRRSPWFRNMARFGRRATAMAAGIKRGNSRKRAFLLRPPRDARAVSLPRSLIHAYFDDAFQAQTTWMWVHRASEDPDFKASHEDKMLVMANHRVRLISLSDATTCTAFRSSFFP